MNARRTERSSFDTNNMKKTIPITYSLILLLMIFVMTSCSGTNQSSQGEEDTAAATSNIETAPSEKVRVSENSSGDLAFQLSIEEFLSRWNSSCSDESALPELDEWDCYVTDRSIHSEQETRHYVYAPGDEKFYPVLHLYSSESEDQILQIELNYDDHNMRDDTYHLYEEMCQNALRCLIPEYDKKQLSSLCTKVNAKAAEHIFQHEQDYHEDAVPAVLFNKNGVGIYPYFAVGSRIHFCIIPVEEDVLADFESEGSEVIDLK